MKKTFFALLLAAIVGTQVVAPPKANAWLVATLQQFDDMTGPEWVLCIVIFPLCVLDEKQNSSHSTSVKDLQANGYSASEINQIVSDQTAVVQALASSKLALQVRSSDTAASISNDIRSVYPAASETYINFVTSSNGLK